jgi:parafibromin
MLKVLQVLNKPSLESIEVNSLKSKTTMVLEGASQYFNEEQRNRAAKKYESASPRSIASFASSDGRLRFGFGLAPWHRRSSHESFLSVSSSVHRLLMGKAPAATPKSEASYRGPEGRLFQKGILNY